MNKINEKPVGRPVGFRVKNPRNKRMPPIQVTESELTAYKSASQREGKTFSAWVRDCLDKQI